ncbi:MAG: hypothetical protein U0M42_02495 [Acutalibacteraceae bacterium]|nr:hypothetical protein [Acutalibacteraceae bacterium]
MISVLPSKDSSEIKELFDKHNLEFNENSGCVIARDKEEILGYCLYSLDEKMMTVFELEPKTDLFLADGILRSAIHNAVCANVIKVYYSDNAPVEVFEKLDFICDKAQKKLDVSKLYKSCHSCSANNE